MSTLKMFGLKDNDADNGNGLIKNAKSVPSIYSSASFSSGLHSGYEANNAFATDCEPPYLTRHFLKNISPKKNDNQKQQKAKKPENYQNVKSGEHNFLLSSDKNMVKRKRGRPSNLIAEKKSEEEQNPFHFAHVNPLIMLCEAAKRETAQMSSGTYSPIQQRNFSANENPACMKPVRSFIGMHNIFNGENGRQNENGNRQDDCDAHSESASTVATDDQRAQTPPYPSPIGLVSVDASPAPDTFTDSDERVLLSLERVRQVMSTKEAQDYLEIACLTGLCEGRSLMDMRSQDNGQLKDEEDHPCCIHLPRACLRILTPPSVEMLVEVINGWIDNWVSDRDGRFPTQLRTLTQFTKMRWVLECAIPELCIFYFIKIHNLTKVMAKRKFLTINIDEH